MVCTKSVTTRKETFLFDIKISLNLVTGKCEQLTQKQDMAQILSWDRFTVKANNDYHIE